MEKIEIDKFEEITKNKYIIINNESQTSNDIYTISNVENVDRAHLKKKILELKRYFNKKENRKGTNVEGKEIVAIINTSDTENENIKSIIVSIKAMFIDNKNERYEYLYNEACKYLDRKFEKNNYCDFKDDICIAKRNCNSQRLKMGCCYHAYKNNIFGKWKFCEHLGSKGCKTQNLACKLMTCDYIKVKFKLKDITYIDCFFNIIQKLILRFSFYQTKEKIMKKIKFWAL